MALYCDGRGEPQSPNTKTHAARLVQKLGRSSSAAAI